MSDLAEQMRKRKAELMKGIMKEEKLEDFDEQPDGLTQMEKRQEEAVKIIELKKRAERDRKRDMVKRNKPEPPTPSPVFVGKVPISPEELNKIIRKRYEIPMVAGWRNLDIYYIPNPDHKEFLKRYARSKRDFEIYYELMRQEMQK